MTDTPNDNHNSESGNNQDDLDVFSRLREMPKPQPRFPVKPQPTPEDPEEDFWATFSMITPTGERFIIDVCFRSRQHYNAEMHKFETSKNLHVVLKDINEESIVIKRDLLLHVLPQDTEEVPASRKR